MSEKTQETPTKRIEIYCREERLVVGHIPIQETGKYQDLGVAFVWHNYEPVDERFTLGVQQRAGQFFSCPHCGGNLCISAIREFPKDDKLPDSAPKSAKAKKRADESQLIQVILGRMKIIV